jgi:formate dehydrogenase major subunit
MPDRPEPGSRIVDEPDVLKILREINGYEVATGKHVDGFANLKDDGSTASASWIYCGIYPEPGRNRAASRQADEYVSLNWGYSWPANRRILYNRASAAPDGQPWSERKKYVWWDAGENRWTGLDVPDFAVGKAPNTSAVPDGVGLDAHSGADPFIMKADGRGWLFAPTGLVDGPMPTYYEPAESPTRNALYPQQTDSPVYKIWDRPDNRLARPEDPNYPIVITTYRLTEHHLSGAMSRWLPWLSELQPELFVELSPELAREKSIANLDWVTVRTPRGACDAKALVTKRLRPLTINGKVVHQIGMPWHWGYMGVVTGDVTNNLTALVGDPNVTIHSAKAFVCNLERSRKA